VKIQIFLLAALIFSALGANAAVDNTYVPNSVAIDKTKEVGEIPFTSTVSPTGAMTYTVPIEVYPGIRDMQPQPALSYNHLSGNGLLGAGWNLSGLSSICRTVKSIYYDGSASGVKNDKTDAFVLDGMRLIKLSGETSTQIKYESEQGQIKVTAFLSGSVVKYFEVYYPNGRKGIYGYTNNAANRLQYPVTSMSDLYGNTITYAYTEANSRYLPDKITYANASVEFQYAPRTDKIVTYTSGLKVCEDKLLKKITCKFGSTVLRNYDLSYTVRQNASLLTEVGCSASNGLSFNPLKFYYGENNTASEFNKAETQFKPFQTFPEPV
jgi:hypothetical protein